MRILRSHRVTASLCSMTLSSLVLFSTAAHAQEPTTTPESTPTPADPGPGARPDETTPPRGERRGRSRRPTLVIEAGTVHPVSGPAIADGVVVVRGDRIVAVGKKGEIELPPNASVRSFPTGHVYPGLVDAASDAFTDPVLRFQGQLDGGVQLADDLNRRGDRSDELVQAGITTAFVTVRTPTLLRGQGAIVRPVRDGFQLWEGHEHAALSLRMTNGPAPSNPLQRQQELQAADGLFEGLEDYRKAATDHQEALKKYEKELADYLAWHEKKKGGAAAGDNKAAPAAPPSAPTDGERPQRAIREGRRPRGGGGGGEEPPRAPQGEPTTVEVEQALATLFAVMGPQDPPKPEPGKQEPGKQEPQNPPKAEGQAAAPAAAEKKDEAPKRPTYPKQPPSDPQKDALLRVVDGELPLRIEAHRPDELRAALRLMRERSLPLVVLEQAYGAAGLGEEMAKQGVSVVLTELLPMPMPKPYEAFAPAALPQALQAKGVPFAIATGDARLAGMLPLMAAAAIGRGLDADAALRAITLTPAEMLGVAKDTGSLEADKFADVLVCDRPLFASDSRVLLVLAKGRPEYEAK